MQGAELRQDIVRLMDAVWKTISFGIGRHNEERVDHALFDSTAWRVPAVAPLKEMARSQPGTVGSGNHYVDLFTDEQDRVWVGCHFGSRGLGHKTATWFLKTAGAKDGMDVEPCVLDASSNLGAEYITAMNLAGEYAYAGRYSGVRPRCADSGRTNRLRKFITTTISHGAKLTGGPRGHVGGAKGRNSGIPGQKGFVGGSMGEQSVILEGVENEAGKELLHCTVHGAGRVMGAWKPRQNEEWRCDSSGEGYAGNDGWVVEKGQRGASRCGS